MGVLGLGPGSPAAVGPMTLLMARRDSNQGRYLGLVPAWQTGPDRTVASTRMFTLRERHATSPLSNKSGDFAYLDAPDWAHVIALTPDRRVIMIEQFRHGLGEVTLELPGGCVDRGEDPLEACRRELLEETGYAGARVELIGVLSSNPAVMNNRTHVGLVRDAAPAGGQHLDASEEIAVRLVPIDEVPGLVRAGVIHHSLVVASLYCLDHARADRAA